MGARCSGMGAFFYYGDSASTVYMQDLPGDDYAGCTFKGTDCYGDYELYKLGLFSCDCDHEFLRKYSLSCLFISCDSCYSASVVV